MTELAADRFGQRPRSRVKPRRIGARALMPPLLRLPAADYNLELTGGSMIEPCLLRSS